MSRPEDPTPEYLTVTRLAVALLAEKEAAAEQPILSEQYIDCVISVITAHQDSLDL